MVERGTRLAAANHKDDAMAAVKASVGASSPASRSRGFSGAGAPHKTTVCKAIPIERPRGLGSPVRVPARAAGGTAAQFSLHGSRKSS
jgi:hypothetical protein